ncbi:hypothetical protein [uncultured Methylobacterium sp.]|jgi:hypothetical protein|uniref:hypothetical protein n=1 Tax=uncultured Methylobacterium sp. TaxID=157278 RepID=UPI00262A17B2|nr:hypothetical protein [uncultured Methylobacterium sp.]
MTDRAEFREERKLKLDYWKTIISLGGLGVLIVAVYQWHHTRMIYRDDVDNKMVAIWMDNVKMLAERPAISAHFVASQPAVGPALVDDDKPDSSVLAFADLRLEVMDYILNSGDIWDDADNLTWKATFLNAFRQSKILCRRFSDLHNNFDNIASDLGSDQIKKDVSAHLSKYYDQKQDVKTIRKRFDGMLEGIEGVCDASQISQ